MTLREDYNRDGYVIVSECVDLPYMVDDENTLKSLLDKNVGNYIGYLAASSKSIEIQRMFLATNLLEHIIHAPVITEQPVLHVMSPNLRIPNGYYGTEAHQDWASTQGSLDCVTIWIPFHDTKDNFPLEVIPGSHLQGLRDGKMNGSVLEVEADDKDFIPIQCEAGDAVFLSGFLVHRTGKKGTFRVAASQRFDNANDPTFIERGYPCAQKRVVDRAISWKPSVGQVRAAYGVD